MLNSGCGEIPLESNMWSSASDRASSNLRGKVGEWVAEWDLHEPPSQGGSEYGVSDPVIRSFIKYPSGTSDTPGN